MDSRFKENPERTFDLVLKVKCEASENEDPVVLWKFPEDFGDQTDTESNIFFIGNITTMDDLEVFLNSRSS